MTNEQITQIKNSWKLLRNVDADLIGDVFYSKLFLHNPNLRILFPGSMNDQYKKLVMMLSFIIARIDRPQEMVEEVRSLAVRHVRYGVKPEHYSIVGEALLWTLEKGLGKDWNKELKDAWLACYNLLSATMIAATQQPA